MQTAATPAATAPPITAPLADLLSCEEETTLPCGARVGAGFRTEALSMDGALTGDAAGTVAGGGVFFVMGDALGTVAGGVVVLLPPIPEGLVVQLLM